MIEFVLVETPCTVPFCLENASKISFFLKVGAAALSSRTLRVVKKRKEKNCQGQFYAYQSRLCSHTLLLAKSDKAQGKPCLPAVRRKSVFHSIFHVLSLINEMALGKTSKAALSSEGASFFLCCPSSPTSADVLTVPLTCALSRFSKIIKQSVQV